tara:strand:- start:43 stop:1050 length:1008 start_codon:yes stop_codon:yes gene_type:complete
MNRLIIVVLFFFSFEESKSQENRNQKTWAIAIHGGAGYIDKNNLSKEMQLAYTQSLNIALQFGEEKLISGGSAVDIVEDVIRILENDSLFNAGRGSVFTANGENELDASIADGLTRNCGAVTGIKGFRHPISVARGVMDSSEHVFFSGEGAAKFAKKQGFEMKEPEWFYTEQAYKAYLRRSKDLGNEAIPWNEKKGTVGCVVLDQYGNLAAGTSTGGMTYKKHGRIGDSPVIGAGTWADNRTCAVSATGWGEFFIRTGVTQDIHSQILYSDVSIQTACEETIFNEMGALGGTGGVIAVDTNGQIALVFNTRGMFRAWSNSKGKKGIAMFGPYKKN